MSNVHLLLSVRITNNGITPQGIYGDIQKYSKVDQFLSAIHTLSKLDFVSKELYITIDDVFEESKFSISEAIARYLPNSSVTWEQLSNFNDWSLVAESLAPELDSILLFTNHDHVYINSVGEMFNRFATRCQDFGNRYIGAVSHWPEYISQFSLEYRGEGNDEIEPVFVGETWRTIGTCLVSRELFQEWWQLDFTNGNKIVRPDNPFGPHIDFPLARLVVPRIELFRHLDGYQHVGIDSSYAKAIRPCCQDLDGIVKHLDWTRGNPPLNCNTHLPNFELKDKAHSVINPIPLLLVASAHRINIVNLMNLMIAHGQFSRIKRIKIILVLTLQSEFRKKILTTIGWVAKLVAVRIKKIPQLSLFLSRKTSV